MQGEHGDLLGLAVGAGRLGFAAVVDGDVRRVPLLDDLQALVSYDRFHGEDDTFGQLTEVVDSSAELIDERGTATERIEATRALIRITDRAQFDRHVAALLRRDIVGQRAMAAVQPGERALRELADITGSTPE